MANGMFDEIGEMDLFDKGVPSTRGVSTVIRETSSVKIPTDLLLDTPKQIEFFLDFSNQFGEKIAGKGEAVGKWLNVLGRYAVGDAELSELEAVDVSDLMDIEGFKDYYYGIVPRPLTEDTEEPVDTEEQDPSLRELIEKYGEDVVKDLQNKYEELKDFVGTIPEDPVGAVKKMADIFIEGATGIPSECISAPGGPTTGPWIDNCVTVGVLIDIGFPGLPSGMGGIFKGATIGEIKGGLEKIGKKFEDIVNGNPTCGEKGDQECTPEQILKDLGDWVVRSVEDIFEKDENGNITVGSVLGTLGGIFGSVLSGVVYDQFKDAINNEVENVIGVPIIPFAPLDECEKNGQTTVETSPGSGQFECGPCKQEGFTPTGLNGECVDPNIIDTPTEGQSEEECNQLGRTHVPDASNKTKGSCGGCKDDINTVPDDPDNPDYSCVPFDDPNPQEGDPCNTGAPLNAEGKIGPAPDFDCIPNEGAECNDPTTGASGTIEEGLCNTGTTQVKCPEGTAKAGQMVDNLDDCGTTTGQVKCPEGTAKAGQMVDNLDDCGTTGGCPAKGTVLDSGCDGTTFFARYADGECGEIYDSVPGYAGCGGGGYECDDPNATVREDGSCGPCKAGYVYDGALEKCVQESVPNPCSDPTYAAANPQECGTGPDCVDCSCAEYAAANPDECGTTPPPETPSGGGGGGGGAAGGSGMFDLESFEITGDPQLLAKMEFPITDFLSGMFKDYV